MGLLSELWCGDRGGRRMIPDLYYIYLDLGLIDFFEDECASVCYSDLFYIYLDLGIIDFFEDAFGRYYVDFV